MSNKVITTQSAQETQEFAEEFSKEILSFKPQKTALVLGLWGNLGSGKTTFVQGFSEGLGIKEKILSPTFVLVKRFKLSDKNFKNFYHIDCYRLKDEKDLEVLGFEIIVSDPKNVIAIEWPERIQKILPKEIISIKFNHLHGDQRELVVSGLSDML